MKSIPLYKFYKHKYGNELLIDVIDIDVMKADISQTSVYCTSFYSIILFMDGAEDIAINGQKQCVEKGMVACSRPGDIWSWPADYKLKGVHLLFEEEFLLSFFNDPLFLNKFVYLRSDRPSSFLHLGEDLFERLIYLYKNMKSEIDNNSSSKDQHLLRAMLYETLTLINRAENVTSTVNADTEIAVLRYIAAFQKQVNEDFETHCDVKHYADILCITPNYLNKIITQHLGMSTKQYILNRAINEAKSLLIYTSLSITEISEKLHFNTTSYFVRLFRKSVGYTPSQFREHNRQ